ncbi:hypothetical protein NDU88_000071 [Pleurodeles waltl]|uniref:Uncharacterized protein n=1 Tax=Pleurodeles waltl TaxID=8319 RepID=A0AAV7S4Z5_PLEWA|nr:hypothetical protein NDU88_000071 [Pleurodeles waltl]
MCPSALRHFDPQNCSSVRRCTPVGLLPSSGGPELSCAAPAGRAAIGLGAAAWPWSGVGDDLGREVGPPPAAIGFQCRGVGGPGRPSLGLGSGGIEGLGPEKPERFGGGGCPHMRN